MRTAIRQPTSSSLRKLAATEKYWFLNAVDAVLGRRPDLVPPRHLSFIGSGDFLQIGNEFLRYFKELADLQPNHRVLDVGCGIGRMAVLLTNYLSSEGSYAGFDIVPHGITWCKEQITSKHRNFHFHLADTRNREYNPGGQLTAAEWCFRIPTPRSISYS
jgi:SAM-dependent methyltransferase